MQIEAHGRTDIGGKRSLNEDALWLESLDAASFSPPPADRSLHTDALSPAGLLLAVSDGVGGCNAGEIASALVVSALHAHLHRARSCPAPLAAREFLSAIRSTDTSLRNEATRLPAHAGMSATLTALWLRPGLALLGQSGDSRLYRRRAGRLEQLSPEHSPVGRMRLGGDLTESEARRHRCKNLIDQSLGCDPASFAPEVLAIDLAPDDIFLLCSDGLTDGLTDATLAELLSPLATRRTSTAQTVRSLIDAANHASGRDNITVIVARLD